MTKEKAREAIESLQDAITPKTWATLENLPSDILGAFLAGEDSESRHIPDRGGPAAPRSRGRPEAADTNDFRFRAASGKDERPATE